jgi:RNA 2',3'-cyclic 3'-phosphodiesterase
MRTFIAVEVPEDAKKNIGEYIESLNSLIPGIKWVAPENLHFTVKFLGEIEEAKFVEVRQCVEAVSREFGPFSMGLSGIGFFPGRERPRVVWIGADGGADILLDLFHELERCLEKIGFDLDDKPFSPHLTIGRAKKFGKVGIPGTLPDFDPLQFEVNGISIMKSTLTPGGPIYERLAESGLNPGAAFDAAL